MIMPLILSIACYTLPFYLPALWPIAWLFPVFLLHGALKKISLKAILFWSGSITAIQLLPLCAALIAMAHGPAILKLIAPALLIAYVSLYPITWLFVTNRILQKIDSFDGSLIVWTFSFWIYLLVMEYALLLPFGRCEGYLFINPLLPMAFAPAAIAPLRWRAGWCSSPRDRRSRARALRLSLW